jgi:hypothetical protein
MVGLLGAFLLMCFIPPWVTLGTGEFIAYRPLLLRPGLGKPFGGPINVIDWRRLGSQWIVLAIIGGTAYMLLGNPSRRG